jgi:hypothetical protein
MPEMALNGWKFQGILGKNGLSTLLPLDGSLGQVGVAPALEVLLVA